MIPRPQYPVFSGTLAELGIAACYYQLDEDNQWAVTLEELERAWSEADREYWVRAIVVINPGNPTGQVTTTIACNFTLAGELIRKKSVGIFAITRFPFGPE